MALLPPVKRCSRWVFEKCSAMGDDDPHFIARGMALGLFVSATPLFPFHTAIAVFLAVVFRASRMAAALGVWFSNPVTMPAMYFGSYKVGDFFLGGNAPAHLQSLAFLDIVHMGLDITLSMLAGGIVIGIFLGVPGYLITHRIVSGRRRHRAPQRS